MKSHILDSGPSDFHGEPLVHVSGDGIMDEEIENKASKYVCH